ncbi:hypothetical protein T9A_00228 [Alcanivorax jadensis T9]|uniref:Uncharacterized protein n=1 Tax=Alcanivorax jadensis T9 TaxID=1177181 RepID=A0ABR4WHR9_9GAMM|nr:hypothetical protein [Alcanivorax jadensis]KGD62908.1 hypothetical protein T9A_00228 [Alcanivorax jadensis T9]
MTRLVIKVNPYNPPFKPAPEPGVYWLAKEHVGDRLHDSHVMARRLAMFRSSQSVLSDCGLGHLAKAEERKTHFIPNNEFLADLSRDGVKAARRYLKNRGAI